MSEQQQKKLKDMLSMSLKLTTQEEQSYDDVKIDDERRKFLDSAINEALENDEGHRIALMTQLFLTYKPDEKFGDEKLEELQNLYEELNYLNEGLDIAKVFTSNGGMKHNMAFLKKSPHEELKIEAANLIGNSTHNNPVVQVAILEQHGIILLLYHIKNSTNDGLVVKSLYALSALVGGNDYAEKELCKLIDDTFFMDIFDRDNEKIRIKSSFLLMKVVSSDALSLDAVERLITNKLVLKVYEIFESPLQAIHGHILNLLLACFGKIEPKKLLTSTEIEKGFEILKNLCQRMKNEDKESYELELESCKKLMAQLK